MATSVIIRRPWWKKAILVSAGIICFLAFCTVISRRVISRCASSSVHICHGGLMAIYHGIFVQPSIHDAHAGR